MSVASTEEMLRKAARTDLAIPIQNQDGSDPFLFEHADRVARDCTLIMDLVGHDRGLDHDTLAAAGLYYPAAWAVQYEDGVVSRSEILTRTLTDVQLELSATRAHEALETILNNKKLRVVCQIIRESGMRHPPSIGAQILAEAANLDQIGPLALWQMIRRHCEEGRGIQAALETWDRQREYNFWHARIKDSFRFEEVKKIAEQRLAELDRFMVTVGQHARGIDLQALVPDATNRAEVP